MRFAHTALFLALTVGLAACGGEPAPADAVAPGATPAAAAEAAPPAADPAGGTYPAAEATAYLMTNVTPMVGGTLVFRVDNGGVRMTGTIRGLAPGATHALHVHETGSCEPPAFESAGPHFNPHAMPHGERLPGGAFHAGDMPNQTADADGTVAVDQLFEGLTLGDSAATDIANRAVVVHAQADDYQTQPSGDAGARIACGVIELTQAPPPPGVGPADELPPGQMPASPEPVPADSNS